MQYNQALLILGQDPGSLYHHRGEHIAHHLEKRFVNVDVVSITKMYDGPGADPIWKKTLLGLRDIFCKRVTVMHTANVAHYVVRFPRRPAVLDYVFRDFWTYASLRRQLNRRYDVCILAHPRLAFVALRLKRLGKIQVLIYDDWDYFPGEYPRKPFWRSIMQYREKMCVRNADGVVSVSAALLELRRRQGAKYTALVPNGVDYGSFQTAQVKTPHPPTLLYMGSLANAWGAELPIMALPLIKRRLPEIRYLVLGRGPDECRLRAIARELGLEDCVHFHGNQKYQDLPRFLAEADIGVATSRDTDFRKYACPLKVVEYMAAGLPVIATRYGETRAIVETASAGETVEFSPEAFAEAVLDVLSNRSKYERYSANAATYAQEHDWERLLDQELAFAKQLA